jgi:hypothetical protein
VTIGPATEESLDIIITAIRDLRFYISQNSVGQPGMGTHNADTGTVIQNQMTLRTLGLLPLMIDFLEAIKPDPQFFKDRVHPILSVLKTTSDLDDQRREKGNSMKKASLFQQFQTNYEDENSMHRKLRSHDL